MTDPWDRLVAAVQAALGDLQRGEFLLIEEEQLIGIKFFTLAAERPLQKFREPMFELRDLLLLLLNCPQELRTQRLQGSDILRQRLGVRAHADIDARTRPIVQAVARDFPSFSAGS